VPAGSVLSADGKVHHGDRLEMKSTGKKRLFGVVGGLFSMMMAALLILSAGWLQRVEIAPSDRGIGNRELFVQGLKTRGDAFSFLVIGDTESSGRAKALMQSAMSREGPSFLVILGDFVKKPGFWNHRFFVEQMISSVKPPFPVFLVAGNHDLDLRGRGGSGGGMTVDGYEALYGPRNFSFIFNNCLFILCAQSDGGKGPFFLNFLKETLKQKGRGRRAIFVLMHAPPEGLAQTMGIPYPEIDAFYALLESYGVYACFFGDYHGAWRGSRQGVNLIVSGGGGRFKSRQSDWGRYHHILKVSVDPSTISEEALVLGERVGFADLLQEWVFIRFFPLIHHRAWLLYAAASVFFSGGIFALLLFLRSFRKAGPNGHHPDGGNH
jgi:hypothetical protein